MQRPTQHYVETCKQYPISTGAAVLLARDLREELNSHIEQFLKNGGEITVIEHHLLERKPIEQMMNFNGNSKIKPIWLDREKLNWMIEKHALSIMLICGRLGIKRQTVIDYLEGKTTPAPHTQKNIQTTIDFMIKQKAAISAENKEKQA